MSLMSMLDRAQGGKLFAHVAQSLDLDEAQTRRAMERLCPAIAKSLKARAAEDDDLLDALLDLIKDGAGTSPLDEPEAIADAEAVSDGHAILEDVYGSRNAAMVALRKVAPDVPERELSKLAPISATAVVAAWLNRMRRLPPPASRVKDRPSLPRRAAGMASSAPSSAR